MHSFILRDNTLESGFSSLSKQVPAPVIDSTIHLPQHLGSGKNWHVQTIRLVEQRLVQSLEDMLPSQKQLAREFAMSESTLKRHFKAIYGKTMYEYYLEKKMELAKRLLQEKKMGVSQTAYMLGYEKVSAFINMFKKYHQVLPGSFNKKER